jgi:hypothetical protein
MSGLTMAAYDLMHMRTLGKGRPKSRFVVP